MAYPGGHACQVSIKGHEFSRHHHTDRGLLSYSSSENATFPCDEDSYEGVISRIGQDPILKLPPSAGLHLTPALELSRPGP